MSPTLSPFPTDAVRLYSGLGGAGAAGASAASGAAAVTGTTVAGSAAATTLPATATPAGQLSQDLSFGAGELDPATRALLFNNADALMWQNLWTLPLFRTPTLFAVRDTYLNVQATPYAGSLFWNAQTWGLRSS